LAIGPALIDELYRAGNNSIRSELFTSGSGSANLEELFNDGGSMKVELRLLTAQASQNPPPTGPPGGNVPEPMSVVIWAVVAGLAIRRRRDLIDGQRSTDS
jgi:hypothetical protein